MATTDKTVISMAFPTKLLKKIDSLAKAEYTTRSDYIRSRLIKDLEKSEPDQLQNEYKLFVAQYGQTLKNLSKR